MPDPYDRFSFATKGESHGVGVGTAGFAGAAGLAAGVVPAPAAGGTVGFAAEGAAGFAGAAAGFSLVPLRSDCTEPGVDACTPPGMAGLSAVGFASPSGKGDEGGLVSSGMSCRRRPTATSRLRENVHFYQLERKVSIAVAMCVCDMILAEKVFHERGRKGLPSLWRNH